MPWSGLLPKTPQIIRDSQVVCGSKNACDRMNMGPIVGRKDKVRQRINARAAPIRLYLEVCMHFMTKWTWGRAGNGAQL